MKRVTPKTQPKPKPVKRHRFGFNQTGEYEKVDARIVGEAMVGWADRRMSKIWIST